MYEHIYIYIYIYIYGVSIGDSREPDMYHMTCILLLIGDARERDIRELVPSEVAHLQRAARLDAKLGYFRDTAGLGPIKA
jgi:hypothetical protein